MALKLSNIIKKFGDKIIFDGFSYEFPSNGLFVLTGNSGIGKTTLLRIISGLDSDYEGEVINGGISNTSIAFQEYRLFPRLSALENAVIPNGSRQDNQIYLSASDLLLKLGFKEEELSLSPDKLSGGMKQRVSLARALLRKAPILLLDEPTKELDEELRLKVYELINIESKNRLVILVTHNKEEITNDNAVEIRI